MSDKYKIQRLIDNLEDIKVVFNEAWVNDTIDKTLERLQDQENRLRVGGEKVKRKFKSYDTQGYYNGDEIIHFPPLSEEDAQYNEDMWSDEGEWYNADEIDRFIDKLEVEKKEYQLMLAKIEPELEDHLQDQVSELLDKWESVK